MENATANCYAFNRNMNPSNIKHVADGIGQHDSTVVRFEEINERIMLAYLLYAGVHQPQIPRRIIPAGGSWLAPS